MKDFKILGTLLALALQTGCRWQPNNLVYIVPDEFRGTIRVQGNQPDGDQAHITNNTRILVVPASGLLRLQGPLPTRGWNTPSARYRDGAAIQVYEPRLHTPDEAIALRPIGSRGSNEDWFVIGTSNDAARSQQEMRGFKWP